MRTWTSTSPVSDLMPNMYEYVHSTTRTGDCPICKQKVYDATRPHCLECNRSLIEDVSHIAYLNCIQWELNSPNFWLDSFVNYKVKRLQGTSYTTLKLSNKTLGYFPTEGGTLLLDDAHLLALTFHVLTAWKQRDKTKRYKISSACIARLQQFDFKKAEQAYIISTL